MISFESVSKVFQDGQYVVEDFSLIIAQGELISLIGPSGCGKTTVMKMVNRLLEPTSGRVLVNGDNVAEVNPIELRRKIGYVIQQIGLLPHMTVAQNIAIVPKLLQWKEERFKERTKELLDIIGLEPNLFMDRYPRELSGGQQQRIGVARALAADPLIILMDEPFSALDPISREQLQRQLKNLQKQLRKTILFVTHDIDEAIELSDRIAIMKKGSLVQVDTPEKIINAQTNEFVRDFIGTKRLQSNKNNQS